jgi:hypothetical protein
VKPLSADDSVAVCHAKVGNCQALNTKPRTKPLGFFLLVSLKCKGFVDRVNVSVIPPIYAYNAGFVASGRITMALTIFLILWVVYTKENSPAIF